jgi:hypothetical protein
MNSATAAIVEGSAGAGQRGQVGQVHLVRQIHIIEQLRRDLGG